MIQAIYDFIRNTIIGETTISGADNLAIILTSVSIVFLFFLLIKITTWAFGFAFRWRRRRN